MTRLSPLKLFAAVAAVVALGVLAVVLLAGGDGEDPQRSADSAKPANARVAAQKAKVRKAWQGLVRKGLKQAGGREVLADWPFSAVRKPEGGMPPRLRAGVGEVLPGSEPLRLRFDEAGYATTPAGGLWVVPGRAVVCIFRAQTLSSSCGTVVEVQRNGVILQVYKVGDDPAARPTSFTVLGLVPDGIEAVELSSKGSSQTVAVAGNAFSAEGNGPIEIDRLVRRG